MDHNKETQIRTFVRNLLNDAPDLSSLTLGSLKLQYMSHLGCESLSPEAKTCMKRVVGEELLNMQVSATDVSESEIASVEPPSNKRKRCKDKKANSGRSTDEELSAKKICRRRTSSGSAESKEEEQIDQNEVKDQRLVQESEKDQDGAEEQMNLTDKPQYLEGPAGDPLEGEQKFSKSEKKPRSRKRPTKASSDEENESSSSMSEIGEEEDKDSTKKGAPGKKWDGKQKGIKEVGGPESRKQQAKSSTDEEKGSSSQSDESSEDDDNVPKKEEAPGNKLDKGKVPTTTTKEDPQDPDSSSSSLTSLEEEKDVKGDGAPAMKLTIKKGDKKKKQREDDSKRATEENKAVLRLKRYISLCGARRNYKKLFEGCGSIRSKVSVLKKELEDLGIEGLPSIEKCKKARKKLEEAKELAELDVSNIITTQGRPTRRGPSAWKEPHSSPAARYKRTVNSGSEEDSPAEKGPNRSRHWGNLQGIISDDGESD
ncbi:HIRA-interacting protein 3-like isoform X2 [Gadus macrocephalus]|uniref:HIRA-interacting protein 3-like isoform X2 n=1 Tax=Gadus macrocephalus TaxID=80720 RepID=UPI0028CB9D6F|nr:HIRA-interacting protein 3-like isoform X2 [Gadus macrocephalus]